MTAAALLPAQVPSVTAPTATTVPVPATPATEEYSA